MDKAEYLQFGYSEGLFAPKRALKSLNETMGTALKQEEWQVLHYLWFEDSLATTDELATYSHNDQAYLGRLYTLGLIVPDNRERTEWRATDAGVALYARALEAMEIACQTAIALRMDRPEITH